MSNGAHSKPEAKVVNTLSHRPFNELHRDRPVAGTGFVYFASTLAEEQIQSCASQNTAVV